MYAERENGSFTVMLSWKRECDPMHGTEGKKTDKERKVIRKKAAGSPNAITRKGERTRR